MTTFVCNFEIIRYIYNYTDQLGNVRLSYQSNGSGAAVLEENNYYPFGLKHEGYNYTSGNPDYRYQYNGKELQDDTGMLDYGWRQYMPELGRWNGMDQLSEAYRSFSPYAYVVNNPITLADPDGRLSQDFMDMVNKSSHGTIWTNRDGNFYSNRGGAMDGSGRSLYSIQAAKENDGGGGFWGGIKNFFGNIFGKKEKGAGISTFLAGATVSRVTTGVVQIGEIIKINADLFYSATGTLVTRSLWALPLILNGDSSHASGYDIPLTGVVDEPAEPDQRIVLYRGVCVGHYDYKNALKGMAVPLGGHNDPDSHNWGDTESVFTSWTTDINTALKFANKNGSGGILLSKDFSIKETIPSPDKYNEQEILIRGTVIGAFPFIQKK